MTLGFLDGSLLFSQELQAAAHVVCLKLSRILVQVQHGIVDVVVSSLGESCILSSDEGRQSSMPTAIHGEDRRFIPDIRGQAVAKMRNEVIIFENLVDALVAFIRLQIVDEDVGPDDLVFRVPARRLVHRKRLLLFLDGPARCVLDLAWPLVKVVRLLPEVRQNGYERVLGLLDDFLFGVEFDRLVGADEDLVPLPDIETGADPSNAFGKLILR